MVDMAHSSCCALGQELDDAVEGACLLLGHLGALQQRA